MFINVSINVQIFLSKRRLRFNRRGVFSFIKHRSFNKSRARLKKNVGHKWKWEFTSWNWKIRPFFPRRSRWKISRPIIFTIKIMEQRPITKVMGKRMTSVTYLLRPRNKRVIVNFRFVKWVGGREHSQFVDFPVPVVPRDKFRVAIFLRTLFCIMYSFPPAPPSFAAR